MEYVIQIKPESLENMKNSLSTFGNIKKITNIGTTFTSLLIELETSEHVSTLEKMENVISISQNTTFHTCD